MSSVDIILSCKDAEDTIVECINSILNQSFENINLFVFDDFSTDSTVDKVLTFKDKRVTLIKSSKNIGTYAAKNYVLKNFCTSKYVALHDADDISLPTRIEKQVKILEGDLSVSCLGTGVMEFLEAEFSPHTLSNKKFINNERVNFYPEYIDSSQLNEIYKLLSNEERYPEYLTKKFCMNGTVMFRKADLDKLGGWDGSTRIAGDTEIFLRSLVLGNIKNIPEVLYKRRFHNNSLTASKSVGIGSEKRKKYNISLADIVNNCSKGMLYTRNMFFPDVEVKVINCAD